MSKSILSKKEYETLSHFRYQLRRFMRFSEEVTQSLGVTHLQYLLLLHIKGYEGREWAAIGELAERLQSHHHGVVSLVSRCEKLGLVYRQNMLSGCYDHLNAWIVRAIKMKVAAAWAWQIGRAHV